MLGCCARGVHEAPRYAIGDRLTLTRLRHLPVTVTQVYLDDRGHWQIVVSNAQGVDVLRAEHAELHLHSAPIVEMVTVTIACAVCRVPQILTVPAEGLRKRQAGALIQDAMPDVPEAIREMFVSRTCGPCFAELFAVDQDEDDDEPAPEPDGQRIFNAQGVCIADYTDDVPVVWMICTPCGQKYSSERCPFCGSTERVPQ
jgi:hypothetical protein